MHNLDHHIAKLLEDHDCVIVPEFGGFVANYASAKVNPVSNRFDPPYRKVSFNKHLVHNDGLLAAYVSQKEEEVYGTALSEVKKYAFYLKDCLKQDQKVSIDKVGLLYQHPDGTLHFEQVRNPAFFKDGFGLDSFFVKRIDRSKDELVRSVKESLPLENEPIVPEPKPTFEPEDDHDTKVIPIQRAPEPQPDKTSVEAPVDNPMEEETKKRRYWPVAAALVGLPLIGYAVWLSLSTPIFQSDDQQFQWSDLNPLRTSSSVYAPRSGAFENNDQAVEETLIIDDHEESLVLKLKESPDKTLVVRLIEPKKELNRSAANLRYHVVGGCFSQKSNADGLVGRFRSRGTNASMIDKKSGLYRVSVQSFATKKEAKNYLASVRNEIPGAWLLYK